MNSMNQTTVPGMMVGWTSPPLDKRCTMDILWGCLATLIACQWSVQHPNMLDREGKVQNTWLSRFLFKHPLAEKGLKMIDLDQEDIDAFCTRLMTCCLGFYGPEWLLGWAFSEYREAGRLRDKVNDMHDTGRLRNKVNDMRDKIKPWTRTHAYCVLMGGLEVQFVDGGGKIAVYTVTEEMLGYVVKGSQLHEEMKDLKAHDLHCTSSKDVLGKIIVCIQLAWFAIQLSARTYVQLPVSQLELATAAYVLFTLPTWFFYMLKPCNMRKRYTISISPDPRLLAGSDPHGADTDSDEIQAKQNARPISNLGEFANNLEHLVETTVTLFDNTVTLSESMFVPQWLHDKPNYVFESGLPVLYAYHVVVPYLHENDDEQEWNEKPGHKKFLHMRRESNLWAMLTTGLGALFACCHLLAWNYEFPTVFEKWTWRIVNTLTIAIPLGYCLLRCFRTIMKCSTNYGWAGVSRTKGLWFVNRILWWSLFNLRLYICVALILSLRCQPEELYTTVGWTKMIPHIH